MSEVEPRGNRRSARIMALEEKARLEAESKPVSDSGQASSNAEAASSATKNRKRGRKGKSIHDVHFGAAFLQDNMTGYDEDTSPEHEGPVANGDWSYLRNKGPLEFILDVLQKQDVQELFAEPVDPTEVVGYSDVIKEPMDFATMRAKLQEGLYTSLEQFERDVFLIFSNAMRFNDSNTVYYAMAERLNAAAHRLLHTFRTEPRNFDYIYTRSRQQQHSNKATSQAGGHLTNCARLGAARGSRDRSNFLRHETERRNRYMLGKFNLNQEKPNVAAVCNSPNILTDVAGGDMPYARSLNRFVEGLGPTARAVADRKLGMLLDAGASSCMSLNPTFPDKSMNYMGPTAYAFSGPSGLPVHDGRIPFRIPAHSSSSFKGNAVYGGGSSTSNDNLFGGRPYPVPGYISDPSAMTHSGHGNNSSGGESIPSRNVNNLGTSVENSTPKKDSMDLLLENIMEIGEMQQKSWRSASGTYYPLTGNEPPVRSFFPSGGNGVSTGVHQSPQMMSPPTSRSNPVAGPSGAARSQFTTFLRGVEPRHLQPRHPTVEVPSNGGAYFMDQRLKGKAAEQPMDWSQLSSWAIQRAAAQNQHNRWIAPPQQGAAVRERLNLGSSSVMSSMQTTFMPQGGNRHGIQGAMPWWMTSEAGGSGSSAAGSSPAGASAAGSSAAGSSAGGAAAPSDGRVNQQQQPDLSLQL